MQWPGTGCNLGGLCWKPRSAKVCGASEDAPCIDCTAVPSYDTDSFLLIPSCGLHSMCVASMEHGH